MATEDPPLGVLGVLGEEGGHMPGAAGDGTSRPAAAEVEAGLVEAASDPELQRAAARLSLWQSLGRASRRLIYSIVMRSGGEPFGAPFELGLQSLTEKVVRRFSQHSFFGFEALERVELRGRRNKFTRHGAAPYRGVYRQAQAALGGGRRSRGLLDGLMGRRRRLLAHRPRD